ncbi:MAG: acyltransferase [Pelobium sp.]
MQLKDAPQKPSEKKRYLELDVLRGLAAISVVLFHYTYGYYYVDKSNLANPSGFLFTYGRMGVQLFFMISGFVILMTLYKAKNLREFIISRFSRLYPTYWACIILAVLFYYILNVPFQKDMYSWGQIVINFTMIQKLFKVKDLDGAYWTLFIELVFYFWMGFIYKVNQLKNIFWIAIFWNVLAILFAVIAIPMGQYFELLLILKFAPFFIGGIGFFLLLKNKDSLKIHFLILFSFSTSILLVIKNPLGFDINEAIIIGVLFSVMYLFVYEKLLFMVWKPLLFLGGISYPLYLIHENIGFGIIYWLSRSLNQISYILITIILIGFIAFLISKYIEKPSQKLLRDYFRKR